MMRTFVAVLLITGSTSVALAQDTALPSQDLPQNGGAGIRTSHITASGETVPNPGASQSAGTTELDRGIQQEDTRIQNSICKGC